MDDQQISVFIPAANDADMFIIVIKHQITGNGLIPGDIGAIGVLCCRAAAMTDDIASVRGIVEHPIDKAGAVQAVGTVGAGGGAALRRDLHGGSPAGIPAQHTIHYRETNISFKNKHRVRKDPSEWLRVENTHEAIIAKDTFEQVQFQIAQRRRQQKDATTQIFSGLLKCADCGWSMGFGTNRQNKTPYSHYHCSRYGQMGKIHCSAHYIRYDVLYPFVLSRLQYWFQQAELDEDKLLRRLLASSNQNMKAGRRKQEAELKKAEKRKSEVDGLFTKIYEDWATGRISEYNFNMLSAKYQNEQSQLEEKIAALRAALADEQESVDNAKKWLALIRQSVYPTELTAPLLNTLIEKILIREAVKREDGSREQEIEIFYRFIGKID